MVEKIVPFLVALGIGLAIGIERERRFPKIKKTMGVRTFTLLALFGALAGYIQVELISLGLTLLAAGLIVSGYLRSTSHSGSTIDDIGLTTEIAAGVTFAVGYIANVDPFLSALIGLTTLVVLLSRAKLHTFSVEKVRPEEIQAAVILFVLGVGILPVLPDKPIDPFGLLNLHRFVMLLVLIGSVQFLGYLATRLFGSRVGFPLSGFMAGFISSTAVFLTMPLRVKESPRLALPSVSAAILATVSTFFLLLIVIGAISTSALLKIAPSIGVAMAIGLVFAFFLGRQSDESREFPGAKNPLSFLSSLQLAALLSGFMIAIGLIQKFLGETGAQVASFLAGLFELHGVSIASASMLAGDKIDIVSAQNNILLAGLASLVSKLAITWVLIRGKYALWITAAIGLMLSGFVATWVLF